MYRYIVVCWMVLLPMVAFSQTFNDALRYSQLESSGTARFMGSGASMSALGADFSTIFTNPAGMAYFRKSEILFTPGFMSVQTESALTDVDAQSFTRSANNFRLGNVGLVLASKPKAGKWTAVNFSMGLNRLANFQQEFYYNGRTGGSIVDRFTALADGLMLDQLDDFEAGLAFDVGAIFGPVDGLYLNDFMNNPNHRVEKTQSVRNSGYVNELGFNLAANYDEKLMVGATIGIPFYSFNFARSYSESDGVDEVPFFNELSFREFLNTSGSGFNMKLGLIYSPVPSVRAGISVHSPTFLRITESFRNEMVYDFIDGSQPTVLNSESPVGEFTYRLATPWRLSGGVGTIIGGSGFLSLDVEYVDFSSSRFNFRSENISDVEYENVLNQDVDSRLKSVFNIRAGGEFAKDFFRLRGGVMLDGSPYFGDNSFNFGYSVGAGIRTDIFFIDLAFVNRKRTELFSPYLVENAEIPTVRNQIRAAQVLLTVGFKI